MRPRSRQVFADRQRSTPELFRGKCLYDCLRDHDVFHDNGLKVGAEGGLNGGDELGFDLDVGRKGARNGGLKEIRIVQAAEDGLCAFCEAFTCLVELKEHFQAGVLLSEQALRVVKLAVNLRELALVGAR